MNTARAVLAAITGALIFLFFVAIAFVLGALHILFVLCLSHGGTQHDWELPHWYVRYYPMYWLELFCNGALYLICYRLILGVKLYIRKHIGKSPQFGDVFVRYGNHPSYPEIFPLVYAETLHLPNFLVMVAKAEHLKHPLGWAWKIIGVIFPIDRSNGPESVAVIRESFAQLLRRNPGAFIMGLWPDGTTPSVQKIQRSREWAQTKAMEDPRWEGANRLQNVTLPKPAGLQALLEVASTSRRIRYVRTRVKSASRNGGPRHLIRDLAGLVGTTITVDIKELAEPPDYTSEDFHGVLVQEFVSIDRWMNT